MRHGITLLLGFGLLHGVLGKARCYPGTQTCKSDKSQSVAIPCHDDYQCPPAIGRSYNDCWVPKSLKDEDGQRRAKCSQDKNPKQAAAAAAAAGTDNPAAKSGGNGNDKDKAGPPPQKKQKLDKPADPEAAAAADSNKKGEETTEDRDATGTGAAQAASAQKAVEAPTSADKVGAGAGAPKPPGQEWADEMMDKLNRESGSILRASFT